jgi:hypothetical protein
MLMLRDYVLASTFGLSVRFQKGKPVHVPAELVAEAMEKGAVPADGLAPEFEEPSIPSTPAGTERDALIMEAVRELADKNDSNDFGANGTPLVKAVERELGFDVDRAEVTAAWKQFRSAGE